VQDKRRKNGTIRRANGDQVNGLHIQRDGFDSDGGIDDAISVQDIDSKMMLAHSPPLDILVRTSGVCRLSDFMLWQVSLYKGRREGSIAK
jgi:hypothetical protein